MLAYCILPDHIHFIWTLPEDDSDYSTRIGLIKAKFSKQYRRSSEKSFLKNVSRINRREVSVWQRRFWEHLIRDEQDLERHIDYIHYNPVKHGLAERVADWPDSSFRVYVKSGIYKEDWGGDNPLREDRQNYGE
jgi:putative transposase